MAMLRAGTINTSSSVLEQAMDGHVMPNVDGFMIPGDSLAAIEAEKRG